MVAGRSQEIFCMPLPYARLMPNSRSMAIGHKRIENKGDRCRAKPSELHDCQTMPRLADGHSGMVGHLAIRCGLWLGEWNARRGETRSNDRLPVGLVSQQPRLPE